MLSKIENERLNGKNKTLASEIEKLEIKIQELDLNQSSNVAKPKTASANGRKNVPKLTPFPNEVENPYANQNIEEM